MRRSASIFTATGGGLHDPFLLKDMEKTVEILRKRFRKRKNPDYR